MATCTSAESILEAAALIKANGKKIDTFTNGTDTETVQLGSGPATPALRNVVRQMLSAGSEIEGTDASGKFVLANSTTETRTLAARFDDIVNAKDFGAVGDGETDDSGSVSAAMAAADGNAVFFPSAHGESYGLDLENTYMHTANLYNQASGALFVSGTKTAPVDNPYAILFAEKFSSVDRSGVGADPKEWDNGAIYGQLNQISGDAFGAAVTGYVIGRGSGDSQLIGVHGRGQCRSTGTDAGAVWGGWFVAHCNASARMKHMIGVEINTVNQNPEGDSGWGTALGSCRGLVIVQAQGSTVPGMCGISIGAHAGVAKWHTGVLMQSSAIMKNTARADNAAAIGDNEQICIQGTTRADCFGGIRFGDAVNSGQWFWYGISFAEASFNSNCAILFGEGQKIKIGSHPGVSRGIAFSNSNATVDLQNLVLQVDGEQVVKSRIKGWMVANTGTPSREAFNSSTVTTEELANRVIALIQDLKTHGLIGV